MIQDPTAAIRAILYRHPDVRALVGENVFAQQLPPLLANADPIECILVEDVVGVGEFPGHVELQRAAFDLSCYAKTHEEAKRIYRTAREILKYFLRESVDGTLVHSFEQINSPHTFSEPNTQWPVTFSSWTALVSEKSTL